MKALVLGGTEFLGRHIANALVSAGHDVTLFNRGLRARLDGQCVETIKGDRRGDLAELRRRRWDIAVDTSGYLPRLVEKSALALRDAVDQYTFVSTLSVYTALHASTTEADSTEPLSKDQEEVAEHVTPPPRSVAGGGYGALYGALKAACERAIEPRKLSEYAAYQRTHTSITSGG